MESLPKRVQTVISAQVIITDVIEQGYTASAYVNQGAVVSNKRDLYKQI